jgi:hypothetical protein
MTPVLPQSDIYLTLEADLTPTSLRLALRCLGEEPIMLLVSTPQEREDAHYPLLYLGGFILIGRIVGSSGL